jgi:hypothetical protein
MLTEDDVERMEEIKEEIKELLDESRFILKNADNRMTYERASSYWLAHIVTSLDNDHDYLGGSMCTLQDSIDELKEESTQVTRIY